MLAVIYVVFMLVCFLLIYMVSRYVFLRCKKKGYKVFSSYIAGVGVALLGLAVIFWDAIPTFYVHNKLCETEAGLVAHQTPSEWAEKNPAQFSSFKEGFDGGYHRENNTMEDTGTEKVYRKVIGQYFIHEVRYTKGFDYAFNNRRRKESLVYAPTGQVLFELVDFFGSAGGKSLAVDASSLGDYKIWTITGSCERIGARISERFYIDDRSFSDLMKIIYGWSAK